MPYTITCARIRESPSGAAVLIEDEDNNEVWFPLSQIESMHFNSEGKGYMIVTDWIAEKKGYL